MKKSYQYIFWDLDGTIMDTYEGISKGMQYALAYFGIREEDENYLEAERLLRILRCVRSLKNSEDISNNSIMREFIGGGIWVK